MKTLNLKKLALLLFPVLIMLTTSCRVRLEAGAEPTSKVEKKTDNKFTENIALRYNK